MKNTFITLKGEVFNTDRFMQGPKLTEGCHWRNSYSNTYVETVGDIESVDPGLQLIFGYEAKVLLAKQYRK